MLIGQERLFVSNCTRNELIACTNFIDSILVIGSFQCYNIHLIVLFLLMQVYMGHKSDART